MTPNKSNLLSKEVQAVISRAIVNQRRMMKTPEKEESTFLSDSIWQVVKCGGGVVGVGCGKRFALAHAKFKGTSLLCPHCGEEN